MKQFHTLNHLRKSIQNLPAPEDHFEQTIRQKQNSLFKPPGSLGELENLVAWLATWQKKIIPSLNRVRIKIFAGNHGVVKENVTPYNPNLTELRVEQIHKNHAAINQLATVAQAEVEIIRVNNLLATKNICEAPAMSETNFLEAVETGFFSVSKDIDLLALGEVGIGNTTIAAALSAALFGGEGAQWISKGAGNSIEYMVNKQKAVEKALMLHQSCLNDPLEVLRHFGGFEQAALFGAILAARLLNVPVLLDGFVCTSAAAVLQQLNPIGLLHTKISHLSAEKGHLLLAGNLDLYPLVAFNMRLGEATGCAVVIPILRGALSCYQYMTTNGDIGFSFSE
ncbi:Nicotinate-nucleotide--dimethylbenzimidazole phosphoribosyltransferase [Commensalibacter sp. Nvir]|uniref:nicotinate-nucleotide--dimethylbenzimidazole phosphoribosyltransferase n=1 Tax=Commensalibacter sp. Nvir TaxID=3069817 RepID=UPI002D62649E|nr:Nicotinate-nucleotide--dimethylbenzimidazole phosphoribosyltransferase [Commensalibacter sp. Nvir]